MKFNLFSKTGIFSAIILLFVAVILISPDAKALLFGAGGQHTSHASAPAPEATGTAESTANKEAENPLAPSLLFKDGSGKTIDISKQQGKVVFINFWATWCPPCIQEIPSIDKLKKQFNEKDMLFLMVDVDGNYKKSSRFIENNNYDLPVYTAVSSIPEELLSSAIPTTVIIDKEGRIVGRHEGGADYMDPQVVKFFKGLINK